ncbi:MAG: hypothetical protein QOD68_1443 [Actinomycetota bacterium]|jgi:hypothetical protein|nr:hypothetical protein [Actinomycetota bacterium]
MRFALRGRGTRHDDLRTARHRDLPVHLEMRGWPRPLG